MTLDDALAVVEKINNGYRDQSTRDQRFAPLWRHPFLCDTFLALLRSYHCRHGSDLDRTNFEIACTLLDPSFAAVLASIEVPVDAA